MATLSTTVAAATSGNNTLIAAPSSGHKLRIKAVHLICKGTVNLYLRSGTAGSFHFADSSVKFAGVAGSTISLVPTTAHYWNCDEALALVLNCDSTAGVVGTIQYVTVDA